MLDTIQTFLLVVVALNTTTGDEQIVGMANADDLPACTYNMGVIGGAWFAQDYIGDIISEYQPTDTGGAYLAFRSKQDPEYIMTMSCEPNITEV